MLGMNPKALFSWLFQSPDLGSVSLHWRDLERAEQWTADQALGSCAPAVKETAAMRVRRQLAEAKARRQGC